MKSQGNVLPPPPYYSISEKCKAPLAQDKNFKIAVTSVCKDLIDYMNKFLKDFELA